MYFDLNVPVSSNAIAGSSGRSQPQSKKAKGKQPEVAPPTVTFSDAQLGKIETRIDLLIRLGYTVIAFNQEVVNKIDPKSHTNILDPLLKQLKKREGILYLKRLTIILDEGSEKGFGLTNANASLFTPYDLLSIQPTTPAAFSLACLTHTVPSPLTTHIISIPLTLPRLPFHMKHTLVRTALKNGAVFEINYTGALQSESERRNWWAAAREVVRVTKGKNLLVSSGVVNDIDLRPPKDVGNLITLLGLAQDLAHNTSTVTPKALVLRAQTRKTHRAVFSEPVLILPPITENTRSEEQAARERPVELVNRMSQHAEKTTIKSNGKSASQNSKKRSLDRDDEGEKTPPTGGKGHEDDIANDSGRKRKKKKKTEESIGDT